jgi:hypothetical protein
MPPLAEWYRGRDAITAFLRTRPLSGALRWRVIPTRANGQLAFGHYRWDEGAQAFITGELAVLTLDRDRIHEITIFRDVADVGRFGLPDRVMPDGSWR